MHATHDTTKLKDAPAVLELAQIQTELGLPDGDFARSVKFAYSGSSWGKIKSGYFSGNQEKALRNVKIALANHRHGGVVEVLDGKVVFAHITDIMAAVDIARVAGADDEHKLVVVCGPQGSGKSAIARMAAVKYPGSYSLHVHPSWSASYYQSLLDVAKVLGMTTEFRSKGEAESLVLARLKASPGLLIIDEANHFSRDFINFLKAVCNETQCAVLIFTLPRHLGRMAATYSEESRQLLRRSVGIFHIPALSSKDVMAIHSSFYPEVTLGNYAPSIVTCANSLDSIDTVLRIFDEANPDDPEDLPRAIDSVKTSLKAVLDSPKSNR